MRVYPNKGKPVRAITAARDGSFFTVGVAADFCAWQSDNPGKSLRSVVGDSIAIVESMGAVVLNRRDRVLIVLAESEERSTAV